YTIHYPTSRIAAVALHRAYVKLAFEMVQKVHLDIFPAIQAMVGKEKRDQPLTLQALASASDDFLVEWSLATGRGIQVRLLHCTLASVHPDPQLVLILDHNVAAP